MKQRMIAMLLAVAMGLSVCAVALAAEEQSSGVTQTTENQTEQTGSEENAEGETAAEGTEAETSVTGEETAEEKTDEEAVEEKAEPQVPVDDITGEPLLEATEDMLLFTELEELIRKNNYTYKSLAASAGAMDDMEDLADSLGKYAESLKTDIGRLDSSADDYEERKAALEKEMANAQAQAKQISSSVQGTTQMDVGRKQLIYGAESLFIMILGLEQQETALERQLKSVDRTMEEMELRHQMGQISKLQLMEVQNGRMSLVSGLASLRMNIASLKLQLEQMVGEEMTGTVVLGTLPQVTDEELDALDFEADLKIAKRKSTDVRAASDQVDQAYDMSDAGMGDAADGMINAADYAYDAAVQQAEMKFRQLWLRLQDCRQVVDAAKMALEVETLACQAAELKYQQGSISRNALLSAEDEMKTAQESLRTAKNDLFATYNDYRWAVKHGILN